MPNDHRQQFLKALMLLDRGTVNRGEAALRQVIADAKRENDPITLVQGLVCLGDLLHEAGRQIEARSFLEQALLEQAQAETRYDDLLTTEFARAKELLDKLA